jgi:hypothetical protein
MANGIRLWAQYRARQRRSPLELLLDTGLFHGCVRRVSRLDHAIDGELAVRDWTVPDFMVAATLAMKVASVLSQCFAYFALE